MSQFKRKLTPFLCQELLYDYATDKLDPNRRAAIEEFLKEDKESRVALEKIHFGLDYTKQLSQASLRPETLNQLQNVESVLSLGRKYSSPSAWPETVRRSLLGAVVCAMVAVLASQFNWDQIFDRVSQQITIAMKRENRVAEKDTKEVDNKQKAATAPTVPKPPTETPPLVVAPAATPSLAFLAKLFPPTLSPLAPSPSVRVQQEAHDLAESDTPVDEESPAPTPETKAQVPEPKASGYVYRAFMDLNDLDTIAPQIKSAIVALEGEKAGEVELGWVRESGRYFHFKLPEANKDKILEELRVYGPVRISKDPHPRVMPEGQVRFILWIESADESNQ